MRRIALPLLALVFLPLTVALPARGETPDERFQLLDVFKLEYATDPRIAPDGKKIVYVRNFMDIMKDRRRSNLWIIDVDGKNHQALTTGKLTDSSPRWSPDGNRLLYISNADGSSQLYCRWLDRDHTAKLTNLPATPSNPAWSPDGKSIVFAMHVAEPVKPLVTLPAKPEGAEWAEPVRVILRAEYRADGQGYLKDGHKQLFLLGAEGGAPRQLTHGPYDHAGPVAWSPDGKTLFFSANRQRDAELDPLQQDIYELSVPAGAIKTLTSGKGPKHHPVVSPDGQHIAYVGFEDRRKSFQANRVHLINRDGSGKQVLAGKLDRNIRSAVWSQDGKGLYVDYEDRGSGRIGFVPLAGEVNELATGLGGGDVGRPYASGTFSVAGNGTLAMMLGTPLRPADVAVVAAAPGDATPGHGVQRLTHLNDTWMGGKKLGQVEEIWYPSSHDGRKIQGWIVRPPGFNADRKYPLILEIHGGPHSDYGVRFSAEIQLYAAAGYVVLYTNPRGSTGYGEEFAQLIHHNYPSQDYDDLMSGVDAVIEKGFIDKDNLFVTGGSGGGVLTAWIVGKTKRFRAAVVCKPVINWTSFVLTADVSPYFTQYWFSAPPWEKPEEYLKRSPLSLVGNVTTPTMLLTGEEDYRTPMSESEQFYQALKLRKIDTVLVRVPGSSHDIGQRPSQMMSKVAHILKWFEMYRR